MKWTPQLILLEVKFTAITKSYHLARILHDKMHEMDTATFLARGVTYGHNEISYRIATTLHDNMHEMDTAAYLARGEIYGRFYNIRHKHKD
jgi:hypothetical protein